MSLTLLRRIADEAAMPRLVLIARDGRLTSTASAVVPSAPADGRHPLRRTTGGTSLEVTLGRSTRLSVRLGGSGAAAARTTG